MSLFDEIIDGANTEIGDTNASIQAGPEGAATTEAATESAASTWNWDKSTPGTGERPDWLPAKYKSAEDVAKAYSELQKKLGSAPDKYDWSQGQNWVDPDYTPFLEMEDVFRSKNVPQEAFDSMLGTVGKFLDEFKIDMEEEKSALGEDAKERLMTLNNWAKANFSDDTYHAITENMRTASAVKAIEEMRIKMIDGNTTIPTGNEAPTPAYTVDDVTREMQENLTKYKEDPKYRAEIQSKFNKISGSSGYVDKHY